MHGITLTHAPADWEVLQQTDGAAEVTLKGSYVVHPAAVEVGVEHVRSCGNQIIPALSPGLK